MRLRPHIKNVRWLVKRHPNHRLVKKIRTYAVEEVARLFGIHRNTVRRWIKVGLQTIDKKRPILILGSDLVQFMLAQRARHKQSCLPGQFFCVRCRAPKLCAGGMADYSPINEKIGRLMAICPDCNSIMNRFVSATKLKQFQETPEITDTAVLPRLREIAQPDVDSDFR